MRHWFMALPLLAAAQSIGPQEARLHAVPYVPKPAVTIRADTNLVDIGVVVRDSRGHSVAGLTRADFEIRDEGKRREIAAFSVETFVPRAPLAGSSPSTATPAAPTVASQPRWMGIVFDDVATPFENLYNAKAAAKRFLTGGLAANDRVGIFTTSTGLVLPFTADATKIAAAIDSIQFRDRHARSSSCPLLTEYDSYSIANNLDADALGIKAQEYNNCAHVCVAAARKKGGGVPPPCPEAASYVQGLARSLWEQIRMNSLNSYGALEDIINFMSHLQGTRVMLLASSGFVSGTLEYEEDRVTEKALRANVVINSLDAKGLYTTVFDVGQGAGVRSLIYQQRSTSQGKSELNDVLGSLADATGGLFFQNNNDLDQGFHELGMQPEASYLLAVAPDKLDGKFHRLKVSLTAGRRLTVQARKGYVASPEKPAQPDAPAQRRLDAEIFTTTVLQDAPVTVSARPQTSSDGRQMGCLTFHVDVAKAQFLAFDGTHSQQYRMIAAFFNPEGSFVAGIEGELDLALQEAGYQATLKAGVFNADMCLPIPSGSYRLRTVVVEGDEKGRYATATDSVELR
jgi:VWFA-related protein